jgi:hypothetical protein
MRGRVTLEAGRELHADRAVGCRERVNYLDPVCVDVDGYLAVHGAATIRVFAAQLNRRSVQRLTCADCAAILRIMAAAGAVSRNPRGRRRQRQRLRGP